MRVPNCRNQALGRTPNSHIICETQPLIISHFCLKDHASTIVNPSILIAPDYSYNLKLFDVGLRNNVTRIATTACKQHHLLHLKCFNNALYFVSFHEPHST